MPSKANVSYVRGRYHRSSGPMPNASAHAASFGWAPTTSSVSRP
ncbi:hypothetical protein [Streptomyces rubrolavendulae]|nr:hypothetical protein [Streptomyces rubrolavendulae]